MNTADLIAEVVSRGHEFVSGTSRAGGHTFVTKRDGFYHVGLQREQHVTISVVVKFSDQESAEEFVSPSTKLLG